MGLAESLIDGATGPLPDKTVANLSMIVTSGRRLANLVNDILDFSKLRHRDLSLNIRPVDVRTVADVVVTMLAPLVGVKELQLLNLIGPETPLVDADEDRVQQILFNLVGNAVKFTDVGMVSVAAKTVDGCLEISVTDTGIGIPENRQDEVFESFAQVDGSMEREYGGTGLGLTVTRQLVALHGGAIGLESEMGKGSRFFFTLPISQADDMPMAAAARSSRIAGIRYREANRPQPDLPEPLPGNPIPENAPNILVVDDEPVNLQVLANHLSMNDYHVTQAPNGIEALAAIDRMASSGRPFDLVLLDVMMPKMSGYEVCQRLREKYPADRLPVVMLTAKNRVEDLVAGLAAGANDYLTKPFSKSELLARIKNHRIMKFLADERQKNASRH